MAVFIIVVVISGGGGVCGSVIVPLSIFVIVAVVVDGRDPL